MVFLVVSIWQLQVNILMMGVMNINGASVTAKSQKQNLKKARFRYNWRIFKRGVASGTKNIRQHAWMTVASVFTMAVTLIMTGLMIAGLVNVNQLATDIQNNVEVRVMIDQKATQVDKDKLRSDIQNMSNVKSVTYSSRQHELNSITHTFGSSFKMFKGDSNPLYDVYVVKVSDPQHLQSIASKISTLGGVQDTQFGGNSARKLIKLTDRLKRAISFITIILVLISLFLISNTIRITMMSRKQEITIMRYVGATNWFIRLPLIVEGVLTGLLAAVPSMIIVDVVYGYGYHAMEHVLNDSTYVLVNLSHSMITIDLLIVLISVIIGIFGSLISIQRFLKD